ncbi:uncharacterized protein B0H64DRAFT_85039 [Chaetomium fimeti]|uniref:Uncharacterized protein n=1 Tax=Chaetomium fimeti TaxID=1854472 RepID=A0AAE0HMF8_9PEZI|nr:hypothetical protein B0H64DRAFT_85039 [Chaetomium fimeti]
MPIRNPFARRPGPATAQDESSRPGSASGPTTSADAAHPGFERVDTVGSKASSAFSIRSSRPSQDTGEYKMSVVDDSGVYLPPSPIEREASWPRRYLARTSTDNKSGSLAVGGSSTSNGEIEHFSISRESFDSYRRSFDISAKSPVVIAAAADARQSLDSSLRPFSPRYHYHPRSSMGDQYQRRWEQPPTPEESETGEEEGRFEDVGLGEGGEGDTSRPGHQHVQQVRKRGFFAKFGSDSGVVSVEEGGSGSGSGSGAGTAMSRFLPTLGGRKRDQSGGLGAELGVMPVERVGGTQMQAQGVEV